MARESTNANNKAHRVTDQSVAYTTGTDATHGNFQSLNGVPTFVFNGTAYTLLGSTGTLLTTKGDILTYSTVPTRLGIGANDTVLVADSAQATGNKWSATLAGLTLTSPTVNSPTISGGTINNAVIGGVTPAAGTFTALAGTTGTFTAAVSITGSADAVQLDVIGNATQTNVLQRWRNSTPTTVASISNLGHALFGTSSSPSANTVLASSKSFTDPAATTIGVDGVVTATYTGANAQVIEGTRGLVTITQTGGNATATVGGRGLNGAVTVNGTTNTVTGAAGVYSLVQNTAAGTLTNGYGVYIDSNVNSGGGTFTNNYGLFINNQTVGGTLNRAIKTGTGLLEFGDAAAFGGATPVTTSQITINKAYTDPAATVSAVDATSSASFTGANAQSIQSLRGIVSISYTGGAYTGNPAGVRGTVTIAGTTNSSTSAMAFWAAVTHSGSGTLSNGYGLRIDSAANSGGGTFTTNYGVYVDTQTVGGTNYAFFANGAGRFSVVGSDTIASAAGATWKGIEFRAATATITGSANITTAAGFNYMELAQPTLSAASALTVTNAATLKIANAPTGAGAGPATITNAYAFWVGAGTSRFDGTMAISGAIQITDNFNINVGTTNGTKIGTATTQKIGFWNVTPVVQPSTTGTTTGFTAGAGTAVKDDSTFTGGTGATAYRISDIVLALKQVGIMAA